jgi:hypothetical protein
MDELARARVNMLRAQIAFVSLRGRETPPLLLTAAQQLESLDVTLARATYLDALSAASFIGHLSSGAGVVEVSRRSAGGAVALAAAQRGGSAPRRPRARVHGRLLDGRRHAHARSPRVLPRAGLR